MTADGACVVAWLRRSAQMLREQRQYLTDLDAAIGDGDGGTYAGGTYAGGVGGSDGVAGVVACGSRREKS